MKFRIYIVLLCVTFIFGGCQDVVQIDLDKGAKKYVIDAFINDLRIPQKVRVTENTEYFHSSEPPPVVNANVVLRDLTAGINYQFVSGSNGYYFYNFAGLTDTIAKVDHQYELNVTIDGYLYKSLTSQKRTAIVDTIISEAIPPGGGFGPPGTDTVWFCSLSAYDITGSNTDYYWVKTIRNDTLLFNSGDINVSIDGTNGPVNIEGIQYTQFTAPITFLGFKLYKRNDICKAEIHSISRETYYFFIQTSAQINNSGLFATTPENVKTNITTPSDAPIKATGWFNMATVASYSIKVQ